MRNLFILLLCVGLTACGTKPKNLKPDKQFPASYPQQEKTVATPASPPENPPANGAPDSSPTPSQEK